MHSFINVTERDKDNMHFLTEMQWDMKPLRGKI